MFNNLNNLIPKIVGNSDLHAKWLNTLSLLEYIGFRKIVKSQQAKFLDLETLGHAVEEGRHALLLKNLAQKIGGKKYSTYSPELLLCGMEAENYFQSLDQYCDKYLESESPELKSRLVYLYVTWLIELRALAVYSEYQEVLAAQGVKLPLSGLLNEEEGHLESVEQELLKSDQLFATRKIELKAKEEIIFKDLIRSLSNELFTMELEPEFAI